MRILAVIGVLAILSAIGAAIFFFGGYYSVAGTMEDLAPVHWALVKVRTASIHRHAVETPPADFDRPETVQAGARAFAAQGCATCHGAPGVGWMKFAEGLHPDPPDLKEVAGEVSASELFWVVKNGINMTGMPSFALAGADDQTIWSIVAFVKKLPTISDADYKAWTAPPAPPPAPPAPPPAATPDAPQQQ